jgi:hypothetical protein
MQFRIGIALQLGEDRPGSQLVSRPPERAIEGVVEKPYMSHRGKIVGLQQDIPMAAKTCV